MIKQHITYKNISRYTNIDKFVNIQYIFLLARRAYSGLFQLAQMWKLLALGVGLVDFLTPASTSNYNTGLLSDICIIFLCTNVFIDKQNIFYMIYWNCQ